MFKFTVSLTDRSYDRKPSNPGAIRFIRYQDCDIDWLAAMLSNGYGFVGDFGFERFPVKDHKNYENFKGSNLISLDFDDCPLDSLDGLLEHCTVKPFLAYETFSHQMEGKGNRYRLVFAFRNMIETPGAFKDAHKWLTGRVLDYSGLGGDHSAASAVQVMYGTNPGKRMAKVGNVIDDVAFSSDDTFCRCKGDHVMEIAQFKSEVKNRVAMEKPDLDEKFNSKLVPKGVKFVSDNWLLENGYANDISGILWVGTHSGYRDGQRRRLKLFRILKGVVAFNPAASMLDILRYAWWLNHRIMLDRLRLDDVIEQAVNAYDEVRICKCFDVPDGWRRKRGYRVVPGRPWLRNLTEEEKNDSQDDDNEYAMDIMYENFVYDGLDIDDPDTVVLCTEQEADAVIDGFFFFHIDGRKKRDMRKYYSYEKQKNHLDYNTFKSLIEGYDGKRSRRKVAEWLRNQGFAVDNDKLREWMKVD